MTGAGGGVVAAQLAATGQKVLIVEAGSLTRAKDMSRVEGEALEAMYDGGGIVCTEDGGMMLVAGATLG